MKVLTDCWCDRWPDARCTRLATQEDLLCDICRTGCTWVRIGDQAPLHVQLVGFDVIAPGGLRLGG